MSAIGRRLRQGAGRLAFPWALLVLLIGLATPFATEAVPLAGAWRPAPADDTAMPRDGFVAFDPAQVAAFRRGTQAAWIRLTPQAAPDPERSWFLVVRSPGLERITFIPSDGASPVTASLTDIARGDWLGHGRIAFPLETLPAPGESLVLRFEAQRGIAAGVDFALLPSADFLREDVRWVVFAAACLAVMVAMAIVALGFALWLRDATFLLYAIYLLSYALIQGLQSGFAFHPLEWGWLAEAPRAWGRTATAISVATAILFASRFAGFAEYVPRGRRLVLAVAVAVAANTLLGLLPFAANQALARALINPLLMLGGPLLLAVAWLAWRRGSRYAGFFLAGWGPLLGLTLLDSAQLYGALPAWTWLGDAALAAGAFEALVLSLGLAERTLSALRDRERVGALLDLDPLTSLFNRRALERRLPELVADAQRTGRALSLMFIDLDRFKALNDRFGHQAGDQALLALAEVVRAEIRSRDLAARYGGEEFVVVLADCARQTAQQIAERLRMRLERLAIRVDETGIPLTASIGVAVLDAGDDPATLLSRADHAMYAAKSQGRNRVALATPGA